MKVGCWLIAMCLTAVLLTACGDGGESDTAGGNVRMAEKQPDRPRKIEHLKLTLAGLEGPESAGILMAEERGYFSDEGLDVDVLTPSNPTSAIGYVEYNVDDLGVTSQPQLVLAREEGSPLVAVGSLVTQPTAAMIWLRESKIRGIADLEGKTIAIAGLSYQEALLESMLAEAGLTLEDVVVEEVSYELAPSLVSGKADAILGSWNVEGLELESRGLHPVVTPVDTLGIPAYEESVLITRADRVAEDPQMIRGFMSAVRRGAIAAIEDPEAVVKAIETGDETNPETDRKEIEAQVEATLPLLSKTGYMSPEQAEQLVVWMLDQGMIEDEMPVSELLTNSYVP